MQEYFIEDADHLGDLLDHLNSADTIAFDTEFVSEFSYQPDLCLIQVATRDVVGCIDPKAIHDLSDFWEILSHPEKEIIVHAAREEFRFCKREAGRRPGKLFDVQVAAGMVGIEFPAAYSTLIQKILRKTVSKGETRTDWRKRPLSDKQVEYAQKDVLFLHALYDWATEKLEKQGRSEWFADEMQQQQRRFENENSEFAWTKLSGVNSLKGSELAIAKELWYWRNREAERRNCPVRRVVRDDLLVELAKRKSSDVNRIRSVRGMDRRDIAPQLQSIADVISESSELPKPRMPFNSNRNQNQQLNLIGQFMNAVLAGICKQHQLAPAIVGNSNDVKDLIAYELKLNKSETEPTLTQGWRADVIGNQMRDVLQGKTAVQIADPLGINPLCFVESE